MTEHNYANVESKRKLKVQWGNSKKSKKPRSARIKKGSMNEFMHVIFTQLTKNDKYVQKTVYKGIRKHGELALDALLKEFGQIHKHDTFIPQMVNDLTSEQRR